MAKMLRLLAIPFFLIGSLIWLRANIQSPETQPPSPTNTKLTYNHNRRTFPKKLWQTSRTFESPGNEVAIQSWLDKNPNHRYERITQQNDEEYVRSSERLPPAAVSTLLQLKDGMLRADLVQYLFLYAEGGVYTDLDTVCLKPITSWIPASIKEEDVNLVIGIEGDCLGGDLIDGFSHCVQFATWTLMVKPGHVIMESIMNHVVAQIGALAATQNTTIANISASYMDVMDTTGPGVYTATIYNGLSEISGTDVTSANFTGMTAPRLIGDVLVLPVTSFGAGLPHSNAGLTMDPAALVQHQFMGSWKGGRPMRAEPHEFLQAVHRSEQMPPQSVEVREMQTVQDADLAT